MRTWKIIEWKNPPAKIEYFVPLDCSCGYEAECPTSIDLPVIASKGMSLIFDPPNYKPPDNYLPDVIKCRKCGRIYSE